MGLERQDKKRKNRKEEFSKLDEFDLSVIADYGTVGCTKDLMGRGNRRL